MGRARNLADVIGGNFDIPSTSLDNAQAALEAGDITADLIADGAVTPAKLSQSYQTPLTAGTDYQTPLTAGTDYLAPDGDGSGLSGLSSSGSKIDLELETGASTTAGKAVSLSANGKANIYPTLNTIGDEITYSDSYSRIDRDGLTRIRAYKDRPSEGQCRLTIYGQAVNPTTLAVTESSTTIAVTANAGSGSSWQEPYGTYSLGDNKYLCYVGVTARDPSSYRTTDIHAFVVSVNTTTGVPTKLGEANYYKQWSGCYAYPSFAYIGEGMFWMGSYRPAGGCSGSDTGWQGTWKYFDGSTIVDKSNHSSTSLHEGWQNNYSSTGNKSYTLRTSDNNWLLHVNGNTLYKKPLTSSGTEPTNTAATEVAIVSDYSTHGRGYFISSTRFLYFYKNSGGVYQFVLYSVSSSGGLTELDTFAVADRYWTGTALTNNTYKEVLIYGNGGWRTLEIDDSDNFLGLNLPITYFGIDDTAIRLSDDAFAVYGNGNSGTFYRKFTANAYATEVFDYLGIASETVSSGTASVTVSGIATGFTGLTAGTTYYLSDAYDGTINTDSTSGAPKIGKAISSTEILLAEIS